MKALVFHGYTGYIGYIDCCRARAFFFGGGEGGSFLFLFYFLVAAAAVVRLLILLSRRCTLIQCVESDILFVVGAVRGVRDFDCGAEYSVLEEDRPFFF